MITTQQLDELEQQALQYYADSSKISFTIEDRQEELEGLLQGWQGLNDASAQVFRQYFLKNAEGGETV